MSTLLLIGFYDVGRNVFLEMGLYQINQAECLVPFRFPVINIKKKIVVFVENRAFI